MKAYGLIAAALILASACKTAQTSQVREASANQAAVAVDPQFSDSAGNVWRLASSAFEYTASKDWAGNPDATPCSEKYGSGWTIPGGASPLDRSQMPPREMASSALGAALNLSAFWTTLVWPTYKADPDTGAVTPTGQYAQELAAWNAYAGPSSEADAAEGYVFGRLCAVGNACKPALLCFCKSGNACSAQ